MAKGDRAMTTVTTCLKHCSVCEGQDHHWMVEYDENNGDARMACKHCEATRDMTDEDFDDEA